MTGFNLIQILKLVKIMLLQTHCLQDFKKISEISEFEIHETLSLPCSSTTCSFDNVTFDTYQNINNQKFSNILINPKESFVSSGTRGVS